MFRLFRNLHVPLRYSYKSFHQSSKTKILNFIETPEYQVSASFFIGISIFGSFCDNCHKNLSSHHETIIFFITKGIIIGLTYPISYPLIALNFLYKNNYFYSS